jgi:hypothetical protein
MLQIHSECVANFLGQRETPLAMGFARLDQKTATDPIDIVEP